MVEDYPGPRDFDPFLLCVYSPAFGYRLQRSDDDTETYLTLFKRNLEFEFPDEKLLEVGIGRMVAREVSQRHALNVEIPDDGALDALDLDEGEEESSKDA